MHNDQAGRTGLVPTLLLGAALVGATATALTTDQVMGPTVNSAQGDNGDACTSPDSDVRVIACTPGWAPPPRGGGADLRKAQPDAPLPPPEWERLDRVG